VIIDEVVNESVITTRVELIDNYTSKMQSIIQITERFTRTTEKVATYTKDMSKKMESNSKVSQVAFSNIGSAAKSASLNVVGLSNSVDTVAGSFSNVIANASTFSGIIVGASIVANMVSTSFKRLASSISSVSASMGSMGTNMNPSMNSTSKSANGLTAKATALKASMSLLRSITNKANQFKVNINAKENVRKTVGSIMIGLTSLQNMAKANIEVKAIKGSKAAQGVQSLMSKLQNLKSGKWSAVISAKDMVTGVANRALGGLRNIGGKAWSTTIKAVDMVSGVSKLAFNGIKKLTGKVWNITLRATDMVTKIIGGIAGKLGKLAKGVTVGIKAGVQGLGEDQLRNVTMSRVITNSGKGKVQSKEKAKAYDRDIQKIGASALLNRSDAGLLGTRGLMISGGNTEKAKLATRNMASVKAFTGSTRTSFEIAEAFSSAKSGDLSSLNNMLGEDYSSFEDAMKGIQEKQGGILDEYEKTIPGKFSMLKHGMLTGMIDAVAPFEGVIVGMMDKVMSMINTVGPGLKDFSERIATVMSGGNLTEGNPMINQIATIIGSIPEAISNVMSMLTESIDFEAIIAVFKPVFDLVTWFLDDINNNSGVASGLMSILGTVITTAFEMMGPVIEAVAPIIQSILTFIAEHSQSINNIISALATIWAAVWGVVGPILQTAWDLISPILGKILDLVGGVAGHIVSLGDNWKKMKAKFAENPVVGTVTTIFSKIGEFFGSSAGKAGGTAKRAAGTGNAFGLSYVPYNDYMTRLHEGEMVLTKQEANKYRSKNGSNMNIGKLADTIVIREEADIDKITSKLVQKLNDNRIAYGGAF
jgi:phage-related protein